MNNEIGWRVKWWIDAFRRRDGTTSGEELAYQIITDMLEALERVEKWKEAVIDACVVSWVLKKEHEHNPKLAVNDLCTWCYSVALDPKVSSDTKKLYDRIAELKAENDALKDAIQSDSPLRLACLGDMNGAYVYEKKLYDATKFLALNQFEEPT